jgi:UV excision repair protein RAD23
MKIVIKTLKNQQLPMEVEESTKLSELKQMI